MVFRPSQIKRRNGAISVRQISIDESNEELAITDNNNNEVVIVDLKTGEMTVTGNLNVK